MMRETHLCVGRLGFSNGAVKCSSGCDSLRQALTDSPQLVREDLEVVLQALLLIFLLLDLMVQVIPPGVQILEDCSRPQKQVQYSDEVSNSSLYVMLVLHCI